MVCGRVIGTQSVCAADSGGPLIPKGIQMGVTSASYGKCISGGLPNLFTKVSSYKLWVQRQLFTYGDSFQLVKNRP
ncbi:hypothetical protein TSAR_009908 [Trichomalopsis sarcophagae]|uniref:Peptidase S1 domain-containing protein n=1 Tax=Trichomalopsis sarcophagae TaxID=543379 RepID=A0A232FM04_9HYME|nr:hypothetical protein TSAR_009908 [Trichomalopsis sarcophagae]